MPQPVCIAPQGGRLCRRSLRDGSAIVGVLHLPAGFVPVEGACYALRNDGNGLQVDTAAVSGGLEGRMQSLAVGDLLCQSIWNKTQDPTVMPVRFIEAFAQDNVWTAYGASHHLLTEDHPNHVWCDIRADGSTKNIPGPIEATGCGIGQLLTTHPVWPDRQGEMHTLSQTQTPWRAHYLAYHKLLAKAANDPVLSDALETTIAKNRIFRELNIGRVDRMYCQYLAKLQERGLMILDAPRSAIEHAKHKQATAEIMAGVVGTASTRNTARLGI